MTRKSIATNMAAVSCDVCGRTLLRGEKADVFLHGGSRRTVCELCTARAANEGWIREGFDDVDTAGTDRGGRGLLGRLRRRERPVPERRAEPAAVPVADVDPSWDEDDAYELDEPAVAVAEAPQVVVHHEPEPAYEEEPDVEPEPVAPVAPVAPPVVRSAAANATLKVERAIELFNTSGHSRTVAGVARSLGAPLVAVRPSSTAGAVVDVVVAWELSWYRYAVDLGDEQVEVADRGSELSELTPAEQQPNAAADARGELHLAPGLA